MSENDSIHIRFTESEEVFRHTLDFDRGIGTFRIARDGGLCDRLVTYDATRWTCACGANGELVEVSAEALAHKPGENGS